MAHDEFEEFEPVRGLPAKLPEGEEILWQGAPDWWALAKEGLSLYWVAGYFVVLFLWRAVVAAETMPVPTAVASASIFLLMGVAGCGLLMLMAFLQARAAVYTVTNKRVVLRIGAALSMTLNLPYTWIGNANLALRKSGTGTIAFELMGTHRFSYLMCWPHVRPWRMARTEPAFRCIPDAAMVAKIIAGAAETRVAEPKIARVKDDAVAAE
ncbi:hypothetical protein Ga0609869_000988 [Rhodovulum iodosum]|uniref:YdbS-like PH domain-containing protein n=1 Tax=Rhodovulum iodosum TaxID=68291 RepID=A0ABV3XQM9_9RHOB|nr:photosynthetic complex putative assembly protein PuhB [Rhodovulum robiginosum]RSK32936.1 PH domain-containing protein [Rhodovulum robiginosum]